MSNQEKYDELDNIISSIDSLLYEVSDRYYIDALNELKFEAQNELDEVTELLQKERDEEEREQENQYWEGVI